jgi:hypothetical protein
LRRCSLVDRANVGGVFVQGNTLRFAERRGASKGGVRPLQLVARSVRLFVLQRVSELLILPSASDVLAISNTLRLAERQNRSASDVTINEGGSIFSGRLELRMEVLAPRNRLPHPASGGSSVCQPR